MWPRRIQANRVRWWDLLGFLGAALLVCHGQASRAFRGALERGRLPICRLLPLRVIFDPARDCLLKHG